MLQNCPRHVRGRFRRAACVALETRSHAVRTQDHQGEVRGWKLFSLLPMLFLRRGSGRRVTKEELCHRFDLFTSGEWASLLHEANIAMRTQQKPVHREDSSERRAAAACLKVQLGEVTKARRCLTGEALAPGNDDTLREMQSRPPQQVRRPIPRQVLEFQPDRPLEVDRTMFVKSLKKNASRGSSLGPGGCTHEHLRVCGHFRPGLRGRLQSGAGQSASGSRCSSDRSPSDSSGKA